MKYKLIKEYPGSPKLGNTIDNLESDWIENYPEFWEVVEKDYEILEVKGKYGAISSYIEELDNDLKDKTIFKIKRLSDGEIFTIGDIIDTIVDDKYKQEILEINLRINYNRLKDKLIFKTKAGYVVISIAVKNKKPLFTTEDGVDIFEGDIFYYVKFKENRNSYGRVFEIVIADRPGCIYEPQYEKYFSTREKAEEYILLNKPVLSLNDINFAISKINNAEEKRNKLKTLVKLKIQQSV